MGAAGPAGSAPLLHNMPWAWGRPQPRTRNAIWVRSHESDTSISGNSMEQCQEL